MGKFVYSHALERSLQACSQFLGLEGSEMRCYFHLVNDDMEILDGVGLEVPDIETARAEAFNAVKELRQESDDTDDWTGWRLNIVCSEGTLICSLSLKATFN